VCEYEERRKRGRGEREREGRKRREERECLDSFLDNGGDSSKVAAELKQVEGICGSGAALRRTAL